MGESKKKCDHLKKQDAATVDPTKLTALTPDVVGIDVPSVVLWFDHRIDRDYIEFFDCESSVFIHLIFGFAMCKRKLTVVIVFVLRQNACLMQLLLQRKSPSSLTQSQFNCYW